LKEISTTLIQSRRCIDEFNQIELLHDLSWDDYEKIWFIHIQVKLLSESMGIPYETEWYVTLPDEYPEGKVRVYPAIENGISDTFYHQANNGEISANGLWRKGDLCLKDPLDDVAGIYEEPNDEFKLLWNINRLLLWIDKANKGELLSDGDFFELPDVRKNRTDLFIFDEDEVSFMQWEDSSENSGIFSMKFIEDNKIFIDTFRGLKGCICKQTAWGSYVSEKKATDYIGIWMKLDKIPVINQWQAPNTYGELKKALELQGINLKELLLPLLDRIRDGKKHPLLIGFPIPERIGDEQFCYHWWSCVLPVLSYNSNVENGFRPNKKGWIHRDFLRIFKDSMILDWSRTENWNQNQIMCRGMFERQITKNRFIIIGAGAIGSVIAEQLVRSGVWSISIMDGDLLSVGNLTRHTLTVNDIDKFKTVSLTERLNNINCHVRAKSLAYNLNMSNIEVLNDYDVIIDCTAKDNVWNLLSRLKSTKIICSVSVGYKAEKMYFLYYKGNQFNINLFDKQIIEHTDHDKQEIINDELPWDGIGCWNPVFPAYYYDMQLAGTVATIALTDLIKKNDIEMVCFVYQKKYDENGMFMGYERI